MTVSQPPILAAEQRAWDYWFVDGLTNLVIGVNTLFMAFCLFNPMHWLPRPLAIVLSLIAMVLYVVIATHYLQIIEWLKTRTTYPRTGYVEAPSENPTVPTLVTVSLQSTDPSPEVQMLRMQRRMTWTIAVALAAVASFAMILIQARWIWTAAGTTFSIAMIIARRDFRMSWIPPVGFPILGLYITAFAPPHRGGAYFISGMGLLFVLDGATTLIRYLLQNPRPKVPTA
jgi:uncharacterized protein YhhL (DUF1145 family)